MVSQVWKCIVCSVSIMCFVDALTCHNKFDVTIVDNVTFDDNTVVSQVYDIISILRCTSLCGEISQCISVVYDGDNRKCSLYNKQAHSVIHGYGLRYAKVIKSDCKVIKNHGEVCYVSDDCTSPNNICTGTCICESGFSYNPFNDSCVPQCSSYGTTFEEHIGFYILGYNNLIVHNTSEQSCMELCLSATSFTCRTAERLSAGTCYMSEHTALTQPVAYRKSSQYTLWQRNCD